MSYYIKEKRTRSPRGLGYLATHPISGDSPVFKMPASPMIPPSMPQLPSNPNGLHPQHSPQQQNVPLQHSPHAYQQGNNIHGNHPSSVPHSPVLSPNQQRPQAQQASPHGPQQTQMSPQQLQHRLPFLPMSHLLPEGMDMAQKSLELAKLGLMNYPFYGKPFPCKPSPPFPVNGHGPISPQFNGLNPHMRQQHIQQEQQIPPNGTQHLHQYHKSHNPLQEIHDNKIQDENGAIDLSKKGSDEALDLAMSEREKILKKVEDPASCLNCLHLRKLKMLRMNVVRMLTILVPNLNFEEKGINAEGDSVDDLLRDVIESNVHDEDVE